MGLLLSFIKWLLILSSGMSFFVILLVNRHSTFVHIEEVADSKKINVP